MRVLRQRSRKEAHFQGRAGWTVGHARLPQSETVEKLDFEPGTYCDGCFYTLSLYSKGEGKRRGCCGFFRNSRDARVRVPDTLQGTPAHALILPRLLLASGHMRSPDSASSRLRKKGLPQPATSLSYLSQRERRSPSPSRTGELWESKQKRQHPLTTDQTIFCV